MSIEIRLKWKELFFLFVKYPDNPCTTITRRGGTDVSTLTARKNCQIKIDFFLADDVISLVIFALRRKEKKAVHGDYVCSEIYFRLPRLSKQVHTIQICRHFLSLAALVHCNLTSLSPSST